MWGTAVQPSSIFSTSRFAGRAGRRPRSRARASTAAVVIRRGWLEDLSISARDTFDENAAIAPTDRGLGKRCSSLGYPHPLRGKSQTRAPIAGDQIRSVSPGRFVLVRLKLNGESGQRLPTYPRYTAQPVPSASRILTRFVFRSRSKAILWEQQCLLMHLGFRCQGAHSFRYNPSKPTKPRIWLPFFTVRSICFSTVIVLMIFCRVCSEGRWGLPRSRARRDIACSPRSRWHALTPSIHLLNSRFILDVKRKSITT